MTRIAICLVLLSQILVQTAQAAEEKLVSIKTERGVDQKFILIRPDNPVASVILFAGGRRALSLSGTEDIGWGENVFVVRTRRDFAAKGLMVALVDAPGDRENLGAKFRISRKHADDMAAVSKYLKRIKDVPVWAVGTSMGTFSAANVAIKNRNLISGLVLTSTLTIAPEHWAIARKLPNAVASMALGRVRAPTLVVSHADDQCEDTPPKGAQILKDRLSNSSDVKIVFITGGDPARSAACHGKSPHGFFGVESKTVDAIADFIKAHSR